MATRDHPKHHQTPHLGWPHQYYAFWPLLMPFWDSQGALNGLFYPQKRPYWEKSSQEPQCTLGMSKTSQNTLSGRATLILCILTHFSPHGLTEKALTSIYLNAAIGESSEITPGTLGIPKWPKKKAQMHDICGTHPFRVIGGVFDTYRVPWGAQELFSQCGAVFRPNGPFWSPCGGLTGPKVGIYTSYCCIIPL